MYLSRIPLAAVGWKFEGSLPALDKYVLLATPHTSNWDGALLLALTRSIGLRISWLIKDDWVKGPMGVLLRGLGAVAVDRSKAHNLVDQMVRAFRESDRLVLAIPPEGTRGRAEYWKSGFYHIARGADVPVVPGYLDYARKRAGMGEPIYLTGDKRADMDHIRAFYDRMSPSGRFADKFGPVRLRDEDAAAPTGRA